MKTRYEISLRGMKFHACVGVLPHERTVPQPIEIDVTVRPREPKGKKVAGLLLDYRKVYEVTASVMEAGPIDYLEGLASAIAERVMRAGRVSRVRVVARKPHVSLDGPLDHAEVAVEVSRDD
jgi:dihydroneopterin aldolase